MFPRAAIPLDAGARATAARLPRSLDGDDAPDIVAAYETERFIDSLIDAANEGAFEGAPAARCHPGQDFRVRKAIDLMRAHVGKRICFDAIARSVGLSRPHFFALFKEQMNVTPNVYWNTRRPVDIEPAPITRLGPHSSTSSQSELSAPPTPMWLGTKSRIAFSPRPRNASIIAEYSASEPSSGFSRAWSVMS